MLEQLGIAAFIVFVFALGFVEGWSAYRDTKADEREREAQWQGFDEGVKKVKAAWRESEGRKRG